MEMENVYVEGEVGSLWRDGETMKGEVGRGHGGGGEIMNTGG
jgi:hypothetical protein